MKEAVFGAAFLTWLFSLPVNVLISQASHSILR